MKLTRNITRALAASILGLSVTAGSIAITAPTAQAYDKSKGKISCKAAKVRINPAKNSTARGIAYRGDKIIYDQFAYKKSERRWYTRGKVTWKSDGAKIYGYVPYGCANPYGTNPAPTPPIPR
ncbi:hypothetical protein ACFWY6_01840 [Streptomyces sp. NPDC059037]|uniref:hypothetical protein n=1 Tax=Streptomyces sp. NPDC059037 TaxID=3346710 RepID=UPI0036D1F36D